MISNINEGHRREKRVYLSQMRTFVVLLAGLFLGGCGSLADLTSDAFEPRGADQSTFLSAFAHCHAESAYNAAGDPSLLESSPNYRHMAVNEMTARCMMNLGYPQRSWAIGAHDYDAALFGSPNQ